MMQNAKTKEKSRLVLRDGSHRFAQRACAHPATDGPAEYSVPRESSVPWPEFRTRSTSAVTDRFKRASLPKQSQNRVSRLFEFPPPEFDFSWKCQAGEDLPGERMRK
ncbi:hypothetical protein BDFB_011589 [Asbolus verrucosus]|uniref:Uncharacterized protein n=1 Tax=Asbolus verrucosus TaxID=1661398 RepID=A0A482VZ93_ASBVE|nr:hypothetical protein BDFB_011589 [Asbolus verrucosus]